MSSTGDVKDYEFEIDASFFAHFEYGEIENGSLTAKLGVSYSSRQLKIELNLKGTVDLVCDRCLETYKEDLDVNYTLYGKFGHSTEQEDIDVFWIPDGQNYIELAPILFDYINLSLPLKKVHPMDEDGKSLCKKEMLDRLNELGINSEEIE